MNPPSGDVPQRWPSPARRALSLGTFGEDLPMGIAHDLFKQLLDEHIVPLMRGHGFRRRSQNWWLNRAESWVVVNIQRRWADADKLEFTVNLGATNERFRDLVYGWKEGVPPHEYDCVLRWRIGFLLPERYDRWWFIDRETDVTHFGRSFGTYLDDLAIPFLQPLLTEEGLRDHWLQQARTILTPRSAEPAVHVSLAPEEIRALARLVAELGPNGDNDLVRLLASTLYPEHFNRYPI